MTSIPAFSNKPNPGTIGLKVQLASDASGNYVPVVALDTEAAISIGGVSQEGAWTVTANAGTNLNTSTLALESGGNLATVAVAQGTGGSGISEPTGGSGILGWLSGIYKALIGTLTVSGTVTANAGTNLSTSALALESGGNLATLADAVAGGKIKVDPSGVTSPVSLASLPALSAGANTIGGILPAPTASSSFAIAPGSSPALEASHVLKASAGNLYSIYAATTSVGGYLMTFNAVSAPADGAVSPIECVYIPANSVGSINFAGAPPDYYSTGIVAVFSTTGPFTKTASATAFFKWRVQ